MLVESDQRRSDSRIIRPKVCLDVVISRSRCEVARTDPRLFVIDEDGLCMQEIGAG